MKILWFITNLSYREDDPYVGCGWINSLLEKLSLQDDVEIAVAFFSSKVKKFTVHAEGKYTQYVIPSFLKKIDKIIRNLTFDDNRFYERESIIMSVVDQFKPDIIHVFGTENSFGLITEKTNIPVIIHIQGILNPCVYKWFPTGYNNFLMLWHTPLIKVIKFSGFWADYIRYKYLAKRELEIYRITKYFNGRTDWDRRVTALINPSAKYYHCDEVLRPSFYTNQWVYRKSKDAVRLISIINPNMYKGIETILETAQHLKMHLNREIKWTVAGVSNESPLVKIFTNKTGIKPKSVNVEFIGSIQEASLVPKMLSSDLFIHASHIDNSSNSLCEAMLLGMPIISSNVGGIQSLLTDNKEGILVQDGESFGMAGAIIELIDHPEKEIAFGEAARNRAVERHDPIKIVNKQLLIYQDILSNHSYNSTKPNFSKQVV